MNIIPIDEVNLNDAKMMHSDVFGSQLFRSGEHQYAFKSHLLDEADFAFESADFTKLLETVGDMILHMTVTEQKCKMCPCDTTLWQMRLLLKDRSIIYVESNGSFIRGETFEL